jgi:hypothetical protein
MVFMYTGPGTKPTVVEVNHCICMFVVGVIAVAVNVGAFELQLMVTEVGLTVPLGAVVFIAIERVCVAVQVLDG